MARVWEMTKVLVVTRKSTNRTQRKKKERQESPIGEKAFQGAETGWGRVAASGRMLMAVQKRPEYPKP